MNTKGYGTWLFIFEDSFKIKKGLLLDEELKATQTGVVCIIDMNSQQFYNAATDRWEAIETVVTCADAPPTE